LSCFRAVLEACFLKSEIYIFDTPITQAFDECDVDADAGEGLSFEQFTEWYTRSKAISDDAETVTE